MAVANGQPFSIDGFVEIVFLDVSFLVANQSVPVRKSSSFDILAGQPEPVTFLEQSSKSQAFHGGPIQ
jgi:hypothetical protein